MLSEPELLSACALAMFVCGVAAFAALTFVPAPYGRYSSSPNASFYSFGMAPVSARVAWLVQEAPSFLLALGAATGALGGAPRVRALSPNAFLTTLFLGHYFYRGFVYPLRIRGGKPTPFGVAALAFAFTAVNGWMQGRWLASIADLDDGMNPAVSLLRPRFLVGVCVWLAGLSINLHSDATLRALRKPGETGYKIPMGGFFEFVSGANFFGEIVEWTGFAIAASVSLLPSACFEGVPLLATVARVPVLNLVLQPPVAFALFTFFK